jgi:hypothetical protein
MDWTVILLSGGAIAVVGLVAFYFAEQEQKLRASGPPDDLDPHTRQAMRESAGSITNAGIGGGWSGL